MSYLDVSGASIYHEVHGEGDPVVLLHGGFCSIDTMRAEITALAQRWAVYAPERPAHGRSADDGHPFSYARMADETLAYLDAVGLHTVDLIGFSDGAVIAILLARDHPGRVRSLTAISGNLNTSAFVPDDEADAAFGDAAVARLSADYDRLSPDGSDHRSKVWDRLVSMWNSQPDIAAESLSAIRCPTLVMSADRDVISIEHSVAIRNAVSGARLCIVPGATHMLLGERPGVVSSVLTDFLSDRP